MSIRRAAVAVLTTSLLVAVTAACYAGDPEPISGAFTNSIIFDRPGLATCTLWLDADRRYAVFCKRPAPARMASADGPWELESREGQYRIDGKRICLRPSSVPGKFGIEADGVLYGASGCYAFQLGELGATWHSLDRKGRTYTTRLVRGR